MGIVAGATFRMRLLAACFFAVILTGAWAFGAETPAAADVPADAKDAKKEAKKDGEKDKEKKEEATEAPEPPAPTAEEIAKRDARAEDYKTLGEKFFKFPVTGSLKNEYVLRKASSCQEPLTGLAELSSGAVVNPKQYHGNDSDQDVRSYLTMDFGDPSKHVAVGHFDLAVDTDIDGYKRKSGDNPREEFISINNTLGGGSVESPKGGPVVRLDSAYVDFNHIPGVAKLRVGRQSTYETPEVLSFDGVRLDTIPFFGDKELVFSFYGGRSVHNYEIGDPTAYVENNIYPTVASGYYATMPNGGGSTGRVWPFPGTLGYWMGRLQGSTLPSQYAWLDNGARGILYDEDVRLHNNNVFLHDLTAGAAVEGRPWEGGRMRLDFQHLTDETWDYLTLANRANNNELTFNVWHDFKDPNVKVNGRVSELDGQLKDAFARVLYYKQDWKLNVAATYQGYFYKQDVNHTDYYYPTIASPSSAFNPTNGWLGGYTHYYYPNPMAGELDPFSQILGDQWNYHQGSLVVTKDWLKCFSTEVGYTIRRNASDSLHGYNIYDKTVGADSYFNRDTDRYYASLSLHDLPKGFDFNVTGNRTIGKGRGATIDSLSAEGSYKWLKQCQTTLGTYWEWDRYSLYAINGQAAGGPNYPYGNADTDTQIIGGPQWQINHYAMRLVHDNLATWYVKQRWTPTRWATLDLGYELEHSNTDIYHTFRATFRFDF